MRFYNTIGYKGEEWRYSFTNPNPLLSEEIKERLLRDMLDMFYDNDKNLIINDRDYSAMISKRGPINIGYLSGVEYVATVETEKGKSHIGILVLDKIRKPI